MKAQQRQKLKTTPCPSFSCGLFRHCTQNVLSPTTSHPPPLPPLNSDHHHPPPPPPPPLSSSYDPPTPNPPPQPDSSSSSSSNNSQSFTQWRFPIPNSPIPNDPDLTRESNHNPRPKPPPFPTANLPELFHVAELQLSSDSDFDRSTALHMLERSLVPNPSAAEELCPESVMGGVVRYLKEKRGAKSATKVLLALCLAEGNRRVAVEAGAVREVVEALADLEGAAAERALAALELLCTVAEGADEVRTHALAVPMMVEVMGKTAGRGKEYAISVLSVIYSGSSEGVRAPPDAVARAVTLALQGGCSARGIRKGAQLLKILQESERSDAIQEGV